MLELQDYDRKRIIKKKSSLIIYNKLTSVFIEIDKVNNEIAVNDDNNDFLINLSDLFEEINSFNRKTFLKDYKLKLKPVYELSFGERKIISFFSRLYELQKKQNELKNGEVWNCILLLDEVELGFHPQWKKRFIQAIAKVIPIIFDKSKVQIIFTTHDPLTLSDIANSNIVYLKKENEKTKVLSESEKPKKSFGANITDLLADSFFIEDGLMGDFAKEKIKETIEWLNNEERDESKKEHFKKIIEIIDEPILRRKLSEMYSNVFDENLELVLIEKEKLEKRKKEIKTK